MLYSTLVGLFPNVTEGLSGANNYDGIECHSRPQTVMVNHRPVLLQFGAPPRVAVAKSHFLNCESWRHYTSAPKLLLVASTRGNLSVPCAHLSVPYPELAHHPGEEWRVAEAVRKRLAPFLSEEVQLSLNVTSAIDRLREMNRVTRMNVNMSWGRITVPRDLPPPEPVVRAPMADHPVDDARTFVTRLGGDPSNKFYGYWPVYNDAAFLPHGLRVYSFGIGGDVSFGELVRRN